MIPHADDSGCGDKWPFSSAPNLGGSHKGRIGEASKKSVLLPHQGKFRDNEISKIKLQWRRDRTIKKYDEGE